MFLIPLICLYTRLQVNEVQKYPSLTLPVCIGEGTRLAISPNTSGSHCVAEVPDARVLANAALSVIASGVGLRGVIECTSFRCKMLYVYKFRGLETDSENFFSQFA